MTEDTQATGHKTQATSPPSPKVSEGRLREPNYQDEQEVISEVKKILWRRLDKKQYKAFVYGSRATGKQFRWSDLDIGILGKTEVPIMKKVDLEEDLDESDIPYIVELVDFYSVNPEFKKRAMEKVIPLN